MADSNGNTGLVLKAGYPLGISGFLATHVTSPLTL